jgi:hypothetical protein
MLFTERNFLLEFIKKKKPIKIRLKMNSPCTFLQVTETSIFAPQDLLFRNKYNYKFDCIGENLTDDEARIGEMIYLEIF